VDVWGEVQGLSWEQGFSSEWYLGQGLEWVVGGPDTYMFLAFFVLSLSLINPFTAMPLYPSTLIQE